MTTLAEARSAANELKRLQEAAQLLPQLEKEQGAHEAKAKIATLRQKLLADNTSLYKQYQELYSSYEQEFLQLLEATRKAHNDLYTLYQLKKAISDNCSKYTGELLDYELKYNNIDVYKSGLEVESRMGEVAPFSLPRVISVIVTNSPLAGELERILNML